MRKMKSMMMGGAILLGLAMCLTSCEGTLDDIFGEWSRPTHGTSDGTKPDSQGNVTSISIAPTTLELAAGETGQLTATVDPSGSAVTWSSDKEEVATVDANGLVTAVAAGIATITAKAGDKTATCEVTVTANPAAVPLTLEAITAGTIVVNSPKAGMQYSLNGGDKTAVSGDINVAAGDKVAFYGNGTTISSYNGTKIGGSGDVFKCKVYGNIMSLVDETGFATNTTLKEEKTFRALFNNNVKLTDASGLLLPAETLANYCYNNMFYGCSSLTAAPALPATTLKENCYSYMFRDCTSLTAAPELKAETLANSCYSRMFQNCTKLTAAPELKAETLAENCYSYMFYGCTSLTAAPALPATTLKESCYSYMFYDCKALTTAPALPATDLANSCYSYMFSGCTSLTTAPALPATTLKESCYSNMFDRCTKLTTAPALKAETLAEKCYYKMFSNCSSLATAPKLPATTLVNRCYYQMFYCCTALTNAYVKAGYTTANNECYDMFLGTGPTAGTLHTTTANKASWNGVWTNWTAADDWTD